MRRLPEAAKCDAFSLTTINLLHHNQQQSDVIDSIHKQDPEIPCPGNPPSLFQVELLVNNRKIILIPLHQESPRRSRDANIRNRQLEELTVRTRVVADPLIVVGGFNATPWSPHLRQLIAANRLRNAADGLGWKPTRPSFMPLLGIPIDHVLFNEQITLLQFSRGPHVGSDHRSLSVLLQLP